MEQIDDYLQALASEAPTPGGGSAATIVAAHGAALVAMVARICAANPKRSETHALAERLVESADHLRAALLDARCTDEEAFAKVVSAQALARDSDAARAARTVILQAALKDAAQAPLNAAHVALVVLGLSHDALDLKNKHLVSDLACAAEFAAAAIRACAYNVRINHRYLQDTTLISEQQTELNRIESECERLLGAVRVAANA